MSRSLGDLTSPAVAAAIARSPIAVLPVGSIEQHGPHLPCATDTLAAELVSEVLAERLDALNVPLGPYGVTPLHRGRPGTVSLRRATFEALVRDVGEELVAMGVETLVWVNWHEGNSAALEAVGAELQREHGVTAVLAQACYTAQRVYAGDGGELTHGGSIETLAVLAAAPDLLRLDGVAASERSERGFAVDAMRRGREVHGFVTDVAELDPAGWYGDPHWATPQRASAFAATLADDLARQVRAVLDVSQGHESGVMHEKRNDQDG
ncbi:creatininase family protein [Conexibacter sp. CPCC 206217]|uniref:creatininase family protein n=1 Tax=Conexibacter sp. CPCC 206217 TaxID=3064574 RepID=UPI002727E1E8|nr:creatininase family protein [Conexibacter sp. CPCC 206217]MDO8213592.1 creatininase family protein [Conexibacter sp. CPCC 206217]